MAAFIEPLHVMPMARVALPERSTCAGLLELARSGPDAGEGASPRADRRMLRHAATAGRRDTTLDAETPRTSASINDAHAQSAAFRGSNSSDLL